MHLRKKKKMKKKQKKTPGFDPRDFGSEDRLLTDCTTEPSLATSHFYKIYISLCTVFGQLAERGEDLGSFTISQPMFT